MIVDQFGEVVKSTVTDEDVSEFRKQYVLAKQSNYDEWEGIGHVVHPSSLGRISYHILRELYTTSSAIRPAVDSISREVSNLPWKVVKNDFKYHNPKELAAINNFLRYPNLDNDKFAAILSSFINDLLVVGKGTIEKVRNAFGDLKEIKVRDAALFTPEINDFGFIIQYVEYKKGTTTPARKHKKDNIIFEYFTPTSYTLGATPIIETIINEVALLMLATKSIAWSFCRDEIPPGILHLGEIGEVALERAKASFEASKGYQGKGKMRVIDNVDQVKWVEFTRSNQEMQVAELIPMIERIVFRNFGLSPVESSQVDISRQVADVSFKSSQSKMVSPVMQTVVDIINNDIIAEFDMDALFMFVRSSMETFSEQSKGLTDLNDRGILTANEVRLKLGFDPVQGGDKRTYKLGNEIAIMDETTGLPIYREKPEPTTNLEVPDPEDME